MSVSAAEIPDKTVLQAIGDRRSIRYYDPEKTVEDWKIQTMLQAGRLASCQGNINATEAIVVTKDSTDLWDEIEECVSGFNVQIINAPTTVSRPSRSPAPSPSTTAGTTSSR